MRNGDFGCSVFSIRRIGFAFGPSPDWPGKSCTSMSPGSVTLVWLFLFVKACGFSEASFRPEFWNKILSTQAFDGSVTPAGGCFKGNHCTHCHYCTAEQALHRRAELQAQARGRDLGL